MTVALIVRRRVMRAIHLHRSRRRRGAAHRERRHRERDRGEQAEQEARQLHRVAFMSPAAIVEYFHQLVDLDLALAVVAGMEGVCDAVLQVVVQDLLLDLVERRPHRAHLVDDVDAIAIFLDHAGNAAHLAFDPAEAGKLRFLHLRVHA